MPLRTYRGALVVDGVGGLAVSDNCCDCQGCEPCYEEDTPIELWDNLRLRLKWAGRDWEDGEIIEFWTNEDRNPNPILYEVPPNEGIRWELSVSLFLSYSFPEPLRELVVTYAVYVSLDDYTPFFNQTLLLGFVAAAGQCPHKEDCSPPESVVLKFFQANAQTVTVDSFPFFPDLTKATLYLDQQ